MAKLNYDELYNEITKFYPLGIKHTDPKYSEYPGLFEMQDLSHKKLAPTASKKWKSLVTGIHLPNNKILRASSESILFDPSYTGRLLVLKEKFGQATFTREIVIHLSVLAPYYTVYGMDKVSLAIDGEEMIFDPIVYVSPYAFYSAIFPVVRDEVEKQYEGVKLIPFGLLSKRVSEVYVSGSKGSADRNASVFQALFTPEDVTSFKLIGDIYYE